MVTTIRNVPDEVLVEILGNLPKKDLKKTRLACSLWSTAGAKWMFQRVYFAPRKEPMEFFARIARNPTFARNVKELIYDGRLFLPELGNFASYQAAFSARIIEELDIYEDHTRNARESSDVDFADEVYQDSIWNMDSLGAGHNKSTFLTGDCKEFYMNVGDSLVRYTRLLDYQERVFKKGRDFKTLCEGLKCFRNISKVGAYVDFDHSSNYNPRVGHTWYSSRTKLEFGSTVPPSRWCRRPRSMDGEQLDQEDHIKWDIRGIQALFRAISAHCSSLKELRIASMDYKAPMNIFQLSNTDAEKFCMTFRCLTTLQLHPYVTKSDNKSEYAKQQHCLKLLLQELQELRTLSSSRWFLEEEPGVWDNESEDLVLSERTDFGLFHGKVWPRLTELILREACVKAGDLRSIIRAHRRSLRDLHLESIDLLGKDGWENLGKEMGQILRLHSVSVSNLSPVSTKTTNSSWALGSGDTGRVFVRNMMHWALPDLLEMEEERYGMITGRLKAGSL